MGSKYSGDYFYKRCEAEPRLTELSDDAAIRLFEAMINSCRLESNGDSIEFALLINDLLRNYHIRLQDLYPVYKEQMILKNPNGNDIDYESLITNRLNLNWREELEIYLDSGLLSRY